MTEIMVRRGRPRDPAKLRSLLEAAGQSFLAWGFERSSMTMIATRAGVSKVTLYTYFPNKLALLERCIRERTERSFDGFDERLYDPGQPARGLHLLGTQLLHLMRAPDVIRMTGMLHGLAGQHPEVCAIYYRAGPELVMRRIADYLARAQLRGSLALPDPDLCSELFLGMLMGPAHNRAILGMSTSSAMSDERLVSEAVAMIISRFGVADTGAVREASVPMADGS